MKKFFGFFILCLFIASTSAIAIEVCGPTDGAGNLIGYTLYSGDSPGGRPSFMDWDYGCAECEYNYGSTYYRCVRTSAACGNNSWNYYGLGCVSCGYKTPYQGSNYSHSEDWCPGGTCPNGQESSPNFHYACIDPCRYDHYLNQDTGECIKCPEGWLGSDGYDHDNIYCDIPGCSDGKYANPNYGDQCMYHCGPEEFFDPDVGTCRQCPEGSYGMGEDGGHFDMQCNWCRQNYYYNLDTHECKPCPENGITTFYPYWILFQPGIENCYQMAGEPGSNASGTFMYNEDCYWKGIYPH